MWVWRICLCVFIFLGVFVVDTPSGVCVRVFRCGVCVCVFMTVSVVVAVLCGGPLFGCFVLVFVCVHLCVLV